MASIQPKGRPDLNMTGPFSESMQDAGSEDEDMDTTVVVRGAPGLQISHLKKGHVLQRDATNLISDATIGYIQWNVKDQLRHGYFNPRPLNEKEVMKLKTEMERSDDRDQHPLHAAVNLVQIESLGIQPSKDMKDAPALTKEQVSALDIVGVAGQHRLAAAEGILTGAEATLAVHKARLQELEHELDAIGTLEAGGSQPTQNPSMGATDSGVTSDDEIDDNEPQSWTLKNVPEIRRRLETEEDSVTYLSLWPMVLLDKVKLSSESKDPKVIQALMSLSSNRAVHQNTGTAYEPWLLARPALSLPDLDIASRIEIALREVSGHSETLMKFGPTRRLVYTILAIPLLRPEFQPSKWEAVTKMPIGTIVILVIQASLDALLKVIEAEDISRGILSALDAAYKNSIQKQWSALKCDFESLPPAGRIADYTEAVRQELQAYALNARDNDTIPKEASARVKAASETVEAVVKERRVPLFSPSFMEDTIKNLPKGAEVFTWAERYFSPDAALFGSFSKAKGKFKRPDPAFAIVNEILYLNEEWRAETANADPILPKLIPLVFQYGGEASAVVAHHMTAKKPEILSDIDPRVYTTFYTSFSAAAGDSTGKAVKEPSSKTVKKKKWPEEEVQKQLKSVPSIIQALSTARAVTRLQAILKDKKNIKSRTDLATRLIHFITVFQDENEEILKYEAVVRFVRGIMAIGVDQKATPCLIAIPEVDAEHLTNFEMGDEDDLVWDKIENPLRGAGIAISKVLAVLPQHLVEDPVQQWRDLLKTIRDAHEKGHLEKVGNKNEKLSSNPSAAIDYIQYTKVPGASRLVGEQESPEIKATKGCGDPKSYRSIQTEYPRYYTGSKAAREERGETSEEPTMSRKRRNSELNNGSSDEGQDSVGGAKKGRTGV